MKVTQAGMFVDMSNTPHVSYSECKLEAADAVNEKNAVMQLRQVGSALATALVQKINQNVPVTIG